MATKLGSWTGGTVVGLVMVVFSGAILLWNAEWARGTYLTPG